MDIDNLQLMQIHDRLPKGKPYNNFSFFSLGYDSSSNFNFERLTNEYITILFETFYDESVSDIFVRSNKIFKEGIAHWSDYKPPIWLDAAYNLAKENSVFFQDSQYVGKKLLPIDKEGFYFHSGNNIIISDLELMVKGIKRIKICDKILENYIKK